MRSSARSASANERKACSRRQLSCHSCVISIFSPSFTIRVSSAWPTSPATKAWTWRHCSTPNVNGNTSPTKTTAKLVEDLRTSTTNLQRKLCLSKPNKKLSLTKKWMMTMKSFWKTNGLIFMTTNRMVLLSILLKKERAFINNLRTG